MFALVSGYHVLLPCPYTFYQTFAYTSTVKVLKGITTLESMIQSSREARNTSYLVCILQFPSLISDGTYSITSIFAALSNERIYDLGPTYNWRVLIERPLMSTSAPRFVLLRTNEMS